jgi:hypothetical protein
VGKDTEISWCDQLLGSMLDLVAIGAKRDAITRIESKFGVVRKRLDMVGVKISAPIISTILTSKMIARKNIEAPTLVFSGESETAPLNELAILVGMMSRAAKSVIVGSPCFAHLDTRFDSVLYTQPILVALMGFRQLALGFVRVLLALKGGYATFKGCIRVFNMNAVMASGVKTIAPAAIFIEVENGLPFLALSTPLESGSDLCQIFFGGYAERFCCRFDCAISGLGHVSP